MQSKGKVYTRKVIAQILGIPERSVRRLTDDGVIEEFSHGHYKLVATVQGYTDYLRSQLGGGDDYNVERAKLTKAKREDAEMDIQLKRNELHRSADVEFIMTNMLIAFKAKMETMPYKVLPLLLGVPEGDNKTIRITEILKTAVDEALDELSEYSPLMFDENAISLELDEQED